MQLNEAPNWLQAADAHNIGNSGTSIFEDVATSIGNAPQAAVVSLASGLNSIYNSGIAVANVFRDESTKFEYSDTGELITSLDEDLGAYYETDPEFFDLAGFIGTSFIPGMAGVKALTAGQKAAQAAVATGRFGANGVRATKLFAPSARTYVEREAADLAARSATFSFRNRNALKSLAAGTQQGVLEGLAFETAVAATMFESPVFEGMDTGDMIKNMALGVGLGGAVGAIGATAGTFFGVKSLLRAADQRQQRFATASTQLELGTPTADRVAAALDDKLNYAQPVRESDVLAAKVAQGETGESITPAAVRNETEQLNRLREANLTKLDNEIRAGIRELTKTGTRKDSDFLGNIFADYTGKMTDEQMFSLITNTRQITRAADELEFTKQIKQGEKLVKQGKMTVDELEEIKNTHNISYVQLHSGGIGDVLSEGPASHMRLADKMTPDQIDRFVTKQNFRVNKPINFATLKARDIAEARWLWSQSKGTGAPNLGAKSVIDIYDLPLFKRAVDDELDQINIKEPSGEVVQVNGKNEIRRRYRQAQVDVAQAQAKREAPSGTIELMSDIRKDFLESNAMPNRNNFEEAFDAQDSYARELTQFMQRRPENPITARDLHYRPKYVKLAQNAEPTVDDYGNVLKGMQQIKYQQKFYKEAAQRATAGYLGEIGEFMPEIRESVLRKVWRGGTGNSMVTNAGGDYGSLESYISRIGQLTGDLKRNKVKAVRQDLESITTSFMRDPEAAIEFSAINNIVANSPEKYVLTDAGDALIPRKLKDYYDKLEAGENVTPPKLAEGTRERIALENSTVQQAVAKHIAMTSARNNHWQNLHTLRGNTSRTYDDTFYPVRRNPRDFKHVAFVKDDSFVGVGHTRMITAPSASKLSELMARVPPEYRVLTTNEADEYYKAAGEWKFDKSLHENYLDTDLNSRGIYSDFFPETDPQQIANTWIEHHTRNEYALATDMVLARYEKEVSELRRLGAQYANVPGSGTGPQALREISKRKNPFESMIKNMLDITERDKTPASQWYLNTQEKLDHAVSEVWAKADEILNTSRYAEQEKVDRINDVFDRVGFKTAYYDATLNALANSRIPKGKLTSFVRRANAFLTTTILRLDPFNALNNLLGNNVILSAEVSSLMKTIREGNTQAAGELAKLSRINLPGTDQTVLSPQKLIANSLRRLTVSPEKDELVKFYRDNGLLPDLADQYYRGLDAATLTGAETVTDLNSKWSKMSEAWTRLTAKGEGLTGNKWTEEFNRMLAGDVMKQITDVAVKHGLIDEREALTYINTMVTRVNGVIRASERPLMFQGPIGQAIGLFQTYQLNLIQQTLRHIGEGRNKQLAIMAGMQSSIYGASSLPGFNLINNHLATASGNREHKDLYSATQVLFGSEGAEWLMYGMPSNILNSALYTRGDTNPRVWHVVPNPTNPQDLPAVSAMADFFSSWKNAAQRIQGGAPVWDSIVSGVEHSGLSRPLAGLAAVSRGVTGDSVYTTQSTGNISYENDLVSLASLSRVLGAKPLDEAIQQNAYFRIKSYAAYDRDKRERVGASIRESITGGGEVTSDQVRGFMEDYLQYGGNQENFNRYFMNQYRKATQSQAAKLAENIDTPYGRRMMEMMGGRESLATL